MTSSTLAYFTKEDTAANVITTGKIDIDLVEQVVNPVTGKDETIGQSGEDNEHGPFLIAEGVMPGQEVKKIVTVKNINNAQPAFVRVKLESALEFNRISDIRPWAEIAEGDTPAEGETTKEIPVAGDSNITIDFNKAYWTDGQDGYFYYNEILGTDEVTQPLFRRVKFSKEMGNEYQESTLTMEIYAEAVQSKNIKDADGNLVTRAIDVPENIWPGYVGAQ